MGAISFPPFVPHPLLRSGHAQTIIGAYLPPGARLSPARRELRLEDGDSLVFYDDCPGRWREGDKVALLMPGLGGSVESVYLLRTAAKLGERGVRTLRMELRGFGSGSAMARRMCHAGQSDDIGAAIRFVGEQTGGSPLFLVTFSMSANIALKYLGEAGSDCPSFLAGAFCTAPPVDLIHCSRNLRRLQNRIYDRIFVQELHRLVRRRRKEVAGVFDRPGMRLPHRLYELDDLFTAPLAGFSSADDYYRRASAAPYLAQIETPTVLVADRHDPLCPLAMYEKWELSPAIDFQVTSFGGHLGYVGHKNGDPDRRWLDWRIVDWVMS